MPISRYERGDLLCELAPVLMEAEFQEASLQARGSGQSVV